MSRLSNQMTRKPAQAKSLINASGQNVICAAKPMISTRGGPSLGPVSSYSIVRLLALTCAMLVFLVYSAADTTVSFGLRLRGRDFFFGASSATAATGTGWIFGAGIGRFAAASRISSNDSWRHSAYTSGSGMISRSEVKEIVIRPQ